VTVGASDRLFGRTGERDALRPVVADVRSGQSAVLVLRGEPGIGKTELLQYLIREASGFRLARAVGAESEMELPFAGLHQLCAPMLERVGLLVEPPRCALRVALGLVFRDNPERFLVALAALGMLVATSEEQPLLCVVDDVEWLDQASAQVLGFVLRGVAAIG
jgi:AAA ATPase-like protein